ncbi:iron-containing alcohol dehydrogenase [Desulforhopalus singaporensis]|uniref:Alcohol dehydrogenase n=1 Tax=Desulforhopalus singaporensis TaxID=91360 RepID=A0A1H0K1F7_9BACT|nr:iron-containing alcohol dehydrogenase [Desulforhopalus singaporensis]SDO49640.1 alcohol dehydrogenase [Desulforhopalus singaporensis]
MDITKFAIPEIIFGRGSMNHAGQCALRLGAKKVFLVSDAGIEHAGWVQRLMDILEKEGIRWIYYPGVTSNPRDFQVEQGAEFYRKNGADVIIAIGGGSALDTAKGIAIIASNGGKIRDYEGANRVHRPLPPMVLITTTAGSGSDISQFCIITDVERGVKMSIITRTLVPNISIVDPLILRTKSKTLIIQSAVDALAHAIESYVSTIASPFTEMHSLKAIDLIIRYLPHAVATQSLDSLEQLSIASVSASMAFSNASLGVEHAIAHSLGGHFDMAHGVIHPILLTGVMRYNIDSAREKLGDIGRVIINKDLGSAEKNALAGIEKLEQFFSSLDVSLRLRDEISEDKKHFLKPICKLAVNDACNLTNPRPASWQELLKICEEVW